MKKRVMLLLAGVCALVVSAVIATAASAKKDPFLGKWYSVDTYDGSNQSLSIGGGPGSTYHVQYRDDGASLCGTDANGVPLYAAKAKGELDGTGGVLAGSLPVICLAQPSYVLGDFGFSLTYDSLTDTFTDSYGVVWHH
jgi:hypothetical protein